MEYKYQQTDLVDWLNHFGETVQALEVDKRFKHSKNFADGYSEAKIIETGLSYLISDFKLHTNIEFVKIPTNEFYLNIHFHQSEFDDIIYCKTGKSVIENSDHFYSIALMTNSFTPQVYKLTKGTSIKSLSILVTEEWLKNNIADLTPEKLELIKNKESFTDFITAKQRKILSDIFNGVTTNYLPSLFIKSRVLRLAEQFLNNLYNRVSVAVPEFTNQKDFHALLKIEHLLLKNYNQDFPSIDNLAKTALMSGSKLKKLFKKAYGMAIYQYYQKNRMHKAKELLTSRKHSVTQVGTILGYQNMSNFSAAFKKEFDCLPSDYKEVI